VNKLNKLKKQKNNYFFISLFLITVILISGCGQFSRVQETKEGTRGDPSYAKEVDDALSCLEEIMYGELDCSMEINEKNVCCEKLEKEPRVWCWACSDYRCRSASSGGCWASGCCATAPVIESE